MGTAVKHLPAFKAFITGYGRVVQALATGASQPFTECPTLNAYDFRPRRRLGHSASRVSAALKELGAYQPRHMDRGVWVHVQLEMIRDKLNLREATREDIAHLVVAFHNYRKLQSGRITKWKLLPK